MLKEEYAILFLKEIRYGQLLCIGIGLVLTGIFAAKLFHIPYLTNLGWAAHFLLFALCPRLPYRSRINPGETMSFYRHLSHALFPVRILITEGAYYDPSLSKSKSSCHF